MKKILLTMLITSLVYGCATLSSNYPPLKKITSNETLNADVEIATLQKNELVMDFMVADSSLVVGGSLARMIDNMITESRKEKAEEHISQINNALTDYDFYNLIEDAISSSFSPKLYNINVIRTNPIKFESWETIGKNVKSEQDLIVEFRVHKFAISKLANALFLDSNSTVRLANKDLESKLNLGKQTKEANPLVFSSRTIAFIPLPSIENSKLEDNLLSWAKNDGELVKSSFAKALQKSIDFHLSEIQKGESNYDFPKEVKFEDKDFFSTSFGKNVTQVISNDDEIILYKNGFGVNILIYLPTQ